MSVQGYRVNQPFIWMFPKNGLPPNHPILIGFSILNILGYPYFWKHPYGKWLGPGEPMKGGMLHHDESWLLGTFRVARRIKGIVPTHYRHGAWFQAHHGEHVYGFLGKPTQKTTGFPEMGKRHAMLKKTIDHGSFLMSSEDFSKNWQANLARDVENFLGYIHIFTYIIIYIYTFLK